MQKLFFYFLLFIAFKSTSQENKIFISGRIIDSLGIVKNANIINLKTKQGTFSFDDGTFATFVAIGDYLQITSVQHITKKIKITKQNIKSKFLTIKLKFNTIILDEFNLKRHNLSGKLDVDVKKIPTKLRDSLLKNTLDFSEINFKEIDPRIDENIKAKPPIVNTVPNFYEGIGTKFKVTFKDKEGILRRKLARKKAFPEKLLFELGTKFFFEELKIPIENYFHFLEYCNPLGIENLHKENKILELIKIFEKESVTYLKIIKKE
ncbi:hypothetical protein [uncultured Polaribacter sp.]|uniref:hypothetical protein n=1 Tax=uncultured Polaribacter sp. TaxID=174711 RepID=UPI002628FBF3|nr:hypothetical protein [uncultured Polaribacter sp.]